MKKTTLIKTMLLLCALVVGSGSVWATDGDTHDFAQTFSEGLNNGASLPNIEIAEQSYTIKEVIITYSYNKSNDVRAEVSVNGISWGQSAFSSTSNLTTTSTLSFTGSAKGAVVVSFTNNSGSGTGKGTLKITNIRLVEGSAVTTINASNVTIAADATSGEIPFSISSPVENTHLTASITAGGDWLSSATVVETNTTTGKVTFNSTANTGAKREGTIHLVYGSISKDVTVTQSGLYSITYSTEQTNGTLTIKNGDDIVASGSKLPAGTVLTIVATPNENYAFRNWQYNKGTGWQTKSTNYDYTIDDNNVEFRANFDLTYPVNFNVNGQVASTARFADGKKITFPASVTSFDGYDFVGWASSAIDGSVADKPTLVDTNNETMGAAEKTYYAVYVKNKYVAAFNAADITATPLTGTRTWTHAGSDISLYISAGQHYTGGTPRTFTVTNGTTNYFQISAPTGYKLNKLTVTISESKYKINSVESGASVSTSSTTQTVSFTSDMNSVKCYATSSNQIRATNIVVEAIKAEGYCTTLTQSAVITAAKYATFYSISALDFTGTGITAYTATDNETSVTLNEITSGKVPAYTPVVLYNADADGTAINVPVIASADAVGDNDLVVSDGTTAMSNAYVLANKTKGVGFYPWTGATLSAGKIYLQAKASYGARAFLGFNDDVTAIEAVKAQNVVKGEYFNLAGQRVAQPNKGLYIVNGKKVVNK